MLLGVLLFVHDSTDPDPLETELIRRLRVQGSQVCEFPLQRRAPEPINVARLTRFLSPMIVVGAFSWGARVAAKSCRGRKDLKLLGLGFPFHPRGSPDDTSRLALLEDLPETLFLQGERDAYGNRAWLRGKSLPPQIRVEWIADGNHRFEPRASGNATREGNIKRLLTLAQAFCE